MWIQLEFKISVQIFDFLKSIQNFKSWYWKTKFSFTKLNRQMVVLEPMNCTCMSVTVLCLGIYRLVCFFTTEEQQSVVPESQ